MTDADALAALAEMSTATISDAMFRMGHKNRTMRHNIKPVDPAMKLHGPACTAHAYPGGTYATGLALRAAQPGEVIVIDAQGFVEAVMWGEICSMEAMANGVAGAVIDGAVRDIAEVIALGFPLFAAGITPGAGTGDKLGEVSLPVQCGGVVVRPGDFIFGDVLGVVVVPPAELHEVHDWCLKVLDKEEEIKAALRARLADRQAGKGTP